MSFFHTYLQGKGRWAGSFYTLLQYWRYRRKALTRHDVHSPFVFSFIEKCLRAPVSERTGEVHHPVFVEQSALREKDLITRIIRYFDIQHCLVLTGQAGHFSCLERQDKDGYMFFLPDRQMERSVLSRLKKENPVPAQLPGLICLSDGEMPENLITQLEQFGDWCTKDTIVLMFDVYMSEAHAKTWKMLWQRPDVTLSIDLFDMGLLFFRKEFKVKQHFVLKH